MSIDKGICPVAVGPRVVGDVAETGAMTTGVLLAGDGAGLLVVLVGAECGPVMRARLGGGVDILDGVCYQRDSEGDVFCPRAAIWGEFPLL